MESVPRRDEPQLPGAKAAIFTSVMLIAQQVAGKAARDTLFLSSFHTSSLPLVMAASAVLSLIGVFWVSRSMARYSPAVVMPLLFTINAAALALAWTLDLSAPRSAAVLNYLQTAVLSPIMITTFWSLINERFEPHTAKHAVSRISGGATLGGVVGGLATWRASTLVQPGTVLLFLAVLNAAGGVGSLLIRARAERAQAPDLPTTEAEPSPLTELRKAPFLRNLGLLVGVGAAISALLDYLLSVQAVQHFGKGQPLLSFFSLFWLGVGVLSFLLQLALGRVALEKLGLAVSIAILPGIIVLGGAAGLAVPGLVSSVMLRGAEAIQRNTLFRSAYELLYTPLEEASKRATKAWIDVGFDRVGTVLGSGVASAAVFLLPGDPSEVGSVVVVLLALATLPLVRRIHFGYVAALEERLKASSRQLEESADFEPPPGSVGGRSSVQLARDKLIEHVEALQPGGLTAILEKQDGSAPAVPGAERPIDVKAHLAATADLLSGDKGRVEQRLAHLQSDGPAVACALLLLGHTEFHHVALAALRKLAVKVTGQLCDCLLDPQVDFVIRRRVPRVLAACPTQRAADGLLLGVADERFEVRYECGRALLAITDANSELLVGRDQVIAAVLREVETKALGHATEEFEEDARDDDANAVVDILTRDRIGRSLEHVFTILSLHFEREPLKLAFRALHHDDVRYRGTALEYLDTILPKEVHDALWPFLSEGAPLPAARPAHDVVADLIAAAAGAAQAPTK